MFDQVIDVRHHDRERRVGIITTVRAQVAYRETQPYHAIGGADSVKLPVGEVAGGTTDSVRAGMSGNERRVRQLRDVPKSLFVEVGEVDHDTQAVAGSYE